MNYKTTNRLLQKGGRRAVFYQVLCALAALAIIAPASYLYGVMTAGEGVNFSLYERVFSETVRPEGDGTLPEREIGEALWAIGGGPIERATFNGLIIWTSTVPKPHQSWERDLVREWARLGIPAQGESGNVRGVLRLGRDRIVLVARESDAPGMVDIFAYEMGDDSSANAFEAVGLPSPPPHAEIFDYSGSSDTGVALAFRADYGGDLLREYANSLEQAGWKELPVPVEREGALLFERSGARLTLRGMERGYYTYVTLVVF